MRSVACEYNMMLDALRTIRSDFHKSERLLKNDHSGETLAAGYEAMITIATNAVRNLKKLKETAINGETT